MILFVLDVTLLKVKLNNIVNYKIYKKNPVCLAIEFFIIFVNNELV